MRESIRKEQERMFEGAGSLSYPGLGSSYMGVNNSEKFTEQHLRSMHIIICNDISIFEM